MDNSVSAKQQIVDRIKQSMNILVTVSANPSVDALSAALAFTLMLNKLDKHATAVFSGSIPPAIKFLDPIKTFENKVDSLRDFIIALDKEKADRLRYKVENDVVKIFITPYHTSITEKDLHFSQGDFNVDLIIALGVERRDDLDRAITAHGRILHDAAVLTINAGNQKSSLGAIDWQDATASSLCEMLLSLSEALQSGLLDQQLSTALLTGIVAATERFSNQRTTPKVMTMAAQLMAAGANQQLIATNLRSLTTPESTNLTPGAGSTKIVENPAKHSDGEMHIRHDDEVGSPLRATAVPPVPAQQSTVEPELPIEQPPAAAFGALKRDLEEATAAQQQAASRPMPAPKSPKQPQQARQKQPKKRPESGYITEKPSWMGRNIQPPTMGGTLSATAEEALEDRMREEEDQRNRTLLTHGETEPQQEPVEPRATLPPVPEPQPIAPPLEAPVEPTSEFVESQPKSESEQLTPSATEEASNQVAAAPEAPTPAMEEPQPEQPLSKPIPPAPVTASMPAPTSAPVIEQPVTVPKPEIPSPQPESIAPIESPKNEPSIEALEQETRGKDNQPATHQEEIDAARQAVSDALEAEPASPIGEPAASIGAVDFPVSEPVTAPTSAVMSSTPTALPNDSSAPTYIATPMPAPTPMAPSQIQEGAVTPQTAPMPTSLPLPPLPDFSTLPPVPPIQQPPLTPLPGVQPPIQQEPTVPPTQQTDPRQFRIPGA